jgi:hypothetical protein
MAISDIDVTVAPQLPPLADWTRGTLDRREWLRPFPSDCLDELAATASILETNPLDTFLLDPADYPLDATRDFMRGVNETLVHGCGFAVLDRLPVAELGIEASKQLYWLLSSMIARPVAQSFKGTMLYDVRDIGLKQGPTVRGDLTNEELNFHTDYGYNCPAPVVGLLVLKTAKSGGVSSIVSFGAVHRAMEERCPELLERLYQPFVWNRAREHPPGDPLTSTLPVFNTAPDAPPARFNPFMIFDGYKVAGKPIDNIGQAALDKIWEIMDEPEMHCEFVLEPGQLQYVGNWRVAHRRTAYEDWPDEAQRRHLVRIFLRDSGRRSYKG